MAKFREVLAQRREEVQSQWQLFLCVFDSELASSPMPESQRDTLRTVMWAGWRACAYTNGIIAQPKSAQEV
jgi:hypothetical protein